MICSLGIDDSRKKGIAHIVDSICAQRSFFRHRVEWEIESDPSGAPQGMKESEGREREREFIQFPINRDNFKNKVVEIALI